MINKGFFSHCCQSVSKMLEAKVIFKTYLGEGVFQYTLVKKWDPIPRIIDFKLHSMLAGKVIFRLICPYKTRKLNQFVS